MNTVKSGARTLEILRLLASSADTKPTLSDVSRALGLPKSSTLALLRTLVAYGFVTFDEPTRTYSIGIRAFEVGSAYLRSLTGDELIRTELHQLSARTSAASQFARLEGTEIVYLFREQPAVDVQLQVAIGGRIPAVLTALGKAILSTLEPATVDLVLAKGWEPRTPKSPRGSDAVRRQIEEARVTGFAVDDEESSLGIICFGAPVRNHQPEAFGALSVTLLKAQLDPAHSDVSAAVVHAARRLSAALGSGTFATAMPADALVQGAPVS